MYLYIAYPIRGHGYYVLPGSFSPSLAILHFRTANYIFTDFLHVSIKRGCDEGKLDYI